MYFAKGKLQAVASTGLVKVLLLASNPEHRLGKVRLGWDRLKKFQIFVVFVYFAEGKLQAVASTGLV